MGRGSVRPPPTSARVKFIPVQLTSRHTKQIEHQSCSQDNMATLGGPHIPLQSGAGNMLSCSPILRGCVRPQRQQRYYIVKRLSMNRRVGQTSHQKNNGRACELLFLGIGEEETWFAFGLSCHEALLWPVFGKFLVRYWIYHLAAIFQCLWLILSWTVQQPCHCYQNR